MAPGAPLWQTALVAMLSGVFVECVRVWRRRKGVSLAFRCGLLVAALTQKRGRKAR